MDQRLQAQTEVGPDAELVNVLEHPVHSFRMDFRDGRFHVHEDDIHRQRIKQRAETPAHGGSVRAAKPDRPNINSDQHEIQKRVGTEEADGKAQAHPGDDQEKAEEKLMRHQPPMD